MVDTRSHAQRRSKTYTNQHELNDVLYNLAYKEKIAKTYSGSHNRHSPQSVQPKEN
eukprot:CAMPEP_0119111202 /NCGR_PEP_ID=MMETSP1180-20130426/34488_1 /TAXON_ID=3052 ORGANISM="Chlamydomonas cf sp, Strain CCMP681" /NCGR_SAMPLE_ID=MMETSP1180 /ASSEMBLY_ACC=CAM_ASM_000741 /LENGTH=55 /DNA_ID=CAMNT_0007098035 /DNA_START=28 /DNA_END=195 /DNA_ORIENTATION=-